MRVTSILSLALVIVFRPCAAVTADAVNAQCYTNNVEFDGDVVANPLFGDDGTSTVNTRDRTVSDCLLDCSLISDANGRPCVAIEWNDGGSALSSTETRKCMFAWACDYTEHWSGGSVFLLPTRDCDEFNIDGFLNDCSADFPAEREALEAVDARVTQLTSDLSTLESVTATSADLDATNIAVDDLNSRLEIIEADIPVEKEALDSVEALVTQLSDDLSALQSESATSADLASAVSDLSARLDSIEQTLSGFSSARMAPAQLDSMPSSTNVSSWILGDKDVLILASLAFSAVLLTALLVVQCRAGKGYKSVRTFAESEAELAQ